MISQASHYLWYLCTFSSVRASYRKTDWRYESRLRDRYFSFWCPHAKVCGRSTLSVRHIRRPYFKPNSINVSFRNRFGWSLFKSRPYISIPPPTDGLYRRMLVEGNSVVDLYMGVLTVHCLLLLPGRVLWYGPMTLRDWNEYIKGSWLRTSQVWWFDLFVSNVALQCGTSNGELRLIIMNDGQINLASSQC